MTKKLGQAGSRQNLESQPDLLVKLLSWGSTKTPLQLAGSQQLPEDSDIFKSLSQDNQIIEPPYDPFIWAQAIEKSTRLNALIRVKALNVCGMGYKVTPIDPVDENTPKSELSKINKETETLKKLLKRPNKEMHFSKLLTVMKIDLEVTGNGYLEIIRDTPGGNVIGIHHVPSHTMRVLSGGYGFVQIRGGKKRYFKNFDSELNIHYMTGENDYIDEKGNIVKVVEDTKVFGNEILHFKIYSPRSSYYGVPLYISCASAIAGNWFAAQRNEIFFENDATPRIMFLVENGSMNSASAEQLKKFISSDARGPHNAHRALVIEASPRAGAAFNKDNTKIKIEKLGLGNNDDASFQEYRKNNDEEIRECFRIHKIFLGTTDSDVNRASAFVGRQVTNEQVFAPEQRDIEFKLNSSIVEAMGLTKVQIKLLPPQVVDPKDKAEVDEVYSKFGGLTLNDLRESQGLDPYPSKFDSFANLPVPLAVEKFKYYLNRGMINEENEIVEAPPQVAEQSQNAAGEGEGSGRNPRGNFGEGQARSRGEGQRQNKTKKSFDPYGNVDEMFQMIEDLL